MAQDSEAYLTGRQEQAAALVAEDRLSDEQIAKALEIARRTLARWKQLPEFIERIDAIRVELRMAIVARGIVEKQNRIDAYNDRWARMNTVLQARAEHYGAMLAEAPIEVFRKAYAKPEWLAPGAETGLLVHTKKVIGSGDRAIEIEEWALDTSLLRELRAHEQQAAQELDQWTERKDVTTGGKSLRIVIEGDED